MKDIVTFINEMKMDPQVTCLNVPTKDDFFADCDYGSGTHPSRSKCKSVIWLCEDLLKPYLSKLKYPQIAAMIKGLYVSVYSGGAAIKFAILTRRNDYCGYEIKWIDFGSTPKALTGVIKYLNELNNNPDGFIELIETYNNN